MAGLVIECVLAALIIRSFSSGKRASNHNYIPFNLIVLALSVAIILVTVDEALSGRGYIMLYLMLLVINISAFTAHEIIVLRSREMQEIIDEKARVDAELESYKLMYEKYENTRILRHDLKEQISALKSLIAEDNHEAIKYADKLGRLGRELDFVEFTDNKTLNILLDRKLSECHEKGIELYIKSNGVSISFLGELDTVSIFSNLINNAMESCVMSEEKNIFIDFTTLNDAFTVIKVENNCDMPPRTEDSILITGKENAELHGIGMKSIESSVKNYNGSMSWSYDSERRFFTVVVMFNR